MGKFEYTVIMSLLSTGTGIWGDGEFGAVIFFSSQVDTHVCPHVVAFSGRKRHHLDQLKEESPSSRIFSRLQVMSLSNCLPAAY